MKIYRICSNYWHNKLKPLTSKTSKEKVAKYKIQFSLSSIKFKSISKENIDGKRF
jgi:hypothetical protein